MDEFLRRQPEKKLVPVITLASFILTGLIGAADHLTGYQLAFSIFYLVPVAAVSWYCNLRTGFILALSSAIVWLAVDASAGNQYDSVLIPAWNTTVRFSFFAIVAYLIYTLRNSLIKEIDNARTDQLTGVYNMNGFMEEALSLWKLAERHSHSITLGYIDLDNFKKVNDTMGHAEGDKLLKAVASVLSSSLRSTDLLGRLGGDEFAVVLPETGEKGAEEVFNKIRKELLNAAKNNNWPVSLSIGATVVMSHYPSLDRALKESDDLMYIAKSRGKDRAVIEEWNPDRSSRENPDPVS